MGCATHISRLVAAVLLPLAAAGVLALGAGPAVAQDLLQIERIASGLPGATYATAPAGDDRIFVLLRSGLVAIVDEGVALAQPFLNIVGRVDEEGEGGLLGIAFPPDYAQSGTFYLYYTTDTDPETPIGDLTARVSRFQAIGDPATATQADASSEEVLFSLAKPTPEHNGGTVAIRDGFLYFAIGDGGGTGDPDDLAQNPLVPLGKVLRLDLSMEPPPVSPWAIGLRNPFRFSFDPLTGDLYIGDVGLDTADEINVEAADSAGGSNFGWDVQEGNTCFADDDPAGEPDPQEPPCGDPSLTPPVFEDLHQGACTSITGGSVYRGAALPHFDGRYFFGEFCEGRVRSFVWDGAGGTVGPVVEHTVEADVSGLTAISAVSYDGAGELLFVDFAGEVFRLVPEPGATALGIASALVLGLLRRRRE